MHVVQSCRQCGSDVESRFRYCPWCSAPQRRKLVEYFAPHPGVPGDARRALRVSRYFGDDDTPAQFRFSIWSGESAEAAVSLPDDEAARLSAFLAGPAPRRRPLIEQLRESGSRAGSALGRVRRVASRS
jgi:hypothetical protein